MKLRNKKTGGIIDLDEWTVYTDADCFSIENDCDATVKSYRYRTLAKLNEEWEDYEPAEPLIKDEKIRKIVRPWANKNMVKRLTVRYKWGEGTALESCGAKITFYDDLGLRNGVTYTIAELCGEEEE